MCMGKLKVSKTLGHTGIVILVFFKLFMVVRCIGERVNIVCFGNFCATIPLKGNDRSLKISCTRSLISPTRRYR